MLEAMAEYCLSYNKVSCLVIRTTTIAQTSDTPEDHTHLATIELAYSSRYPHLIYHASAQHAFQ